MNVRLLVLETKSRGAGSNNSDGNTAWLLLIPKPPLNMRHIHSVQFLQWVMRLNLNRMKLSARQMAIVQMNCSTYTFQILAAVGNGSVRINVL